MLEKRPRLYDVTKVTNEKYMPRFKHNWHN